jgi:hypothetical protein
MVDEVRGLPTGPVEHCPWCSAEIAPALHTCPACGATLVGDNDATLPGVTALDPEAIARAARGTTPPRRSRMLSWISGDYPEPDEVPARPGSLGPPPPEVRREMLRLEIAAEVANLSAEAESIAAESEAEARARRASVSPAPTASPTAPSAAQDEAGPPPA